MCEIAVLHPTPGSTYQRLTALLNTNAPPAPPHLPVRCLRTDYGRDFLENAALKASAQVVKSSRSKRTDFDMAAIMFVHGTGVRRPSYVATYAILEDCLSRYAIPGDLAPCLWGDDLGAVAPALSLPTPPPEAKPAAWSEEQEFARWDLLYQDPLFELRLLKQRPSDGPVPSGIPRPDRELWKRIQAYRPSAKMNALLRRFGLEAYWQGAWERTMVDDPTGAVLNASPDEIGEPGQAIARALVASLLISAIEDGSSLPDGHRRDEMVDLLVDEWQARVAGIGTFLMSFFGDAVATVATPIIRWKRGQLSTAAAPAAGDVLLYQARGAKIRQYVKHCAEALKTDVVILTHSLGGIASVDLLAMEEVPCVKKLITVGSQAPLLHEIGALHGLEPGTKALPSHFPEWLNIYDPNDFLSYLAGLVFASPKVRDCRVESGQPFPQSHSAYWANPDTWEAIRNFL